MKLLATNSSYEIETVLNNFKEELSILKTSEEYRQNMAKKFQKYGNVIYIEEENILTGFIAFYNNDIETKTAYISFIAVKKSCQKTGIGSLLLKKCEELSLMKGMIRLRLEVQMNNSNAQSFYINHGFEFENNASENSIYMSKLLK